MGSANNEGIKKTSIMLSRNSPIAFVVGAAGFLGSHLVDRLLQKGIQVVAVDNLATGERRNLEDATKHGNFHFLNESITSAVSGLYSNSLPGLDLPRLDYAFFTAEGVDNEKLLGEGLHNFLSFTQRNSKFSGEKVADRPKVVFVSSIELYDSDLSRDLALFKEAEIYLSKFSKEYKLNARIVRLSGVFGPRMHFRSPDPVSRLVQHALCGQLTAAQTALDFSTRAIFVEDAVDLIIKSVLSGATAQKIFDGVSTAPLKVSEIRQILLDPLWYESKGFKPTELPPWPTPNAQRTYKELSWTPKKHVVASLRETIAYFKDRDIKVSKFEEKIQAFPGANRSLASVFAKDEPVKSGEGAGKNFSEKESMKETQEKPKHKPVSLFLVIAGVVLILAGIAWPLARIGFGLLQIRQSLKTSALLLQTAEFDKAQAQIVLVQESINTLSESEKSLNLLKKIAYFDFLFAKYEDLLGLTKDGMDGVYHAIRGSKSLFTASKFISGEDKKNPETDYESAALELKTAFDKLAAVQLKLSDPKFSDGLPELLRSRVGELEVRLKGYSELVGKTQAASRLLPSITALDGKKSYLVLLQDETELRPTGGLISSVIKLTFENGKLTEIKAEDISKLDAKLDQLIDPPGELRNDLNLSKWTLKDSNYDPDFPTSARMAQFFYSKEAGERVNGIFTMDLKACGKLLKAVGGVDLPGLNLHIDEQNLYQEGGRFLPSLQKELLNKIFFVSKQNWPAIIQALSASLDEKHLMVYLSDTQALTLAASENWIGLLPRPSQPKEGETQDFLYVNEANVGLNKVNQSLVRTKRLQTTIRQSGEVSHKLKINYKNTDPANKYKFRIRFYLPAGSKLVKAIFKEADIGPQLSSYSDYGRAVYSGLIEVEPGETTDLAVDYSLSQPVGFKDGKVLYQLNALKQPGTGNDSFDWVLAYPPDWQVDSPQAKDGQLFIQTDLREDRLFKVSLAS